MTLEEAEQKCSELREKARKWEGTATAWAKGSGAVEREAALAVVGETLARLRAMEWERDRLRADVRREQSKTAAQRKSQSVAKRRGNKNSSIGGEKQNAVKR